MGSGSLHDIGFQVLHSRSVVSAQGTFLHLGLEEMWVQARFWLELYADAVLWTVCVNCVKLDNLVAALRNMHARNVFHKCICN